MTAVGTVTREAGAMCDDQLLRAKEEGNLEHFNVGADEGDDPLPSALLSHSCKPHLASLCESRPELLRCRERDDT